MQTNQLETPPWLSNANTSLFLRRANADLAVALQPIVQINNGRTTAFESLVRNTEKIGFRSVEELFSHAHRHGVLLQIECLLMRKALAAFAGLRQRGWSLLFLNLDGRLLGKRQEVSRLLTQYALERGIEPGEICIELSERNQTLPLESFAEEVDQLKKAGFCVAIDDFGTGTSGLQMLYTCNPHFLKIDRFFVSSIQADPKKRLMVSTVVDLAHTMGMRVVAEGIESPQELHACRAVRCDLAQGYLIEKPLTELGRLRTQYSVITDLIERRERTALNRDGVHGLVQPLKSLPHGATLLDVFELFKTQPSQTVIPIVDGGGLPKGVIRERDIKPFIYSPFGRDLLLNKSTGFGLKDFIRTIPTADINSQLSSLLDLVAERSDDGILVTEGMRYLGLLPASALVRLSNDIRLRAIADQNPLTRLPANQAIKIFMDEAGANRDALRSVCYVDLDNFKPFNDRYGFRIGDRALMLLADRLRDLQRQHDVFVGHVGGDDFFVGAMGESARGLADRLEGIRAKFKRDAESLYSQNDRLAGHIVAKSRTGEEERFPLLDCTVVLLEIEPQATSLDGEDLAKLLARLKAQAKLVKGVVLTERVGGLVSEAIRPMPQVVPAG